MLFKGDGVVVEAEVCCVGSSFIDELFGILFHYLFYSFLSFFFV